MLHWNLERVGETLHSHAVSLIEKRYPHSWGGAAAVLLDNLEIVTSIAPETQHDALAECIELGAILEAHKRDRKITHCICLMREDERSPFKILTPCGICQERLRHWGANVMVGVTTTSNATEFKSLDELQPNHWSEAYRRAKM